MNIKDIALLAETSVATVSRVINNEDNVSPETKRRVLEVIEATGYQPNMVGRALRSQKSRKVLVLLPSIANPFYSRVLEGVENRARAKGYDTIACIAHRDAAVEAQYLDLLKTKQVDGAISFTTAMPEEKLQIISRDYPYVQCGARTHSSKIPCVCIDNVAATREAVSYFVQTGHSRIAFINGAFSRTYEAEREQGYREGLSDHQLPFREDYICCCDYDVMGGYYACEKLMTLAEPPTAIFTSSDQTAAGVCKYLLNHGKQPGKDVDVIGFDGTFLSDMCTPAISSVKQPGYEMGKTAFDLLYERISDPQAVVKRITMLHTLIHKETTHPLPKAKTKSALKGETS